MKKGKPLKLTDILGLYLLGAILGAALIVYVVIKPLYNSGHLVAAQVAATNLKITELRQLQTDTAKLHQSYDQVASQRNAILQLLPVQADEANLLAQLNNLATGTGVVLSDFSPTTASSTTPNPVTSVNIYPVSVNISGTYAEFQNFLSQLENGARFISVQSASLANNAGAGQAEALTVQLALQAYYQGSVADEGVGQ